MAGKSNFFNSLWIRKQFITTTLCHVNHFYMTSFGEVHSICSKNQFKGYCTYWCSKEIIKTSINLIFQNIKWQTRIFHGKSYLFSTFILSFKKKYSYSYTTSLKNELFDSKFNIPHAELRNSLINVNFWDLNNFYTSNIMEMKKTGFSGMY